MLTINLYLAGAISYLKEIDEYDKAILWRIQLINKLTDLNNKLGYIKYRCFDPTTNFEENDKTASNKTIVQQNDYYLDKCDIMIVNLEHLDKSPGTLYEIYKYKFLNKPVIAFGNNDWADKPHVVESITVCLSNIDGVVDYLESYYYT